MTIGIQTLWFLWECAPLCHSHHSSGRGGSMDPQMEAILNVAVPTMLLLFAGTVLMCCVAGPLIFIGIQKIRNLLLAIPAVNSLFYLIAMAVRPYPGGFWAQFQVPGLIYTILELILLVLATAVAVGLLLLLYIVVRVVRKVSTSRTGNDQPLRGVPADPSATSG